MDTLKQEELFDYFCKILGVEKYEENPRDKELKNIMITAKLTAKSLTEGKYLEKPPEEVHKDVNMGAITRNSHRYVEAVKDISYNKNNLTIYKTISYSTIPGNPEKYDYMEFLDLVKK
jgi:hypothetical protein